MHDIQILCQAIFDGLAQGSLYALLGLAVTLVYGLSGVVNFAVGDMMMVGALTATSAYGASGSSWVAAIVAVATVGALALVMERGAFQFTYRSPLSGFIVSLGLIIVLESVAVDVWGTDSRNVEAPFLGSFKPLGFIFRYQSLLLVAVSLSVIACFFLLLRKTPYGMALRAASDDAEAASLMGIPVRRMAMITFIVSGLLAGLAGWQATTIGTVGPFVGSAYILRAFAVALIGGLGSVEGATLAGFGLGIAESLVVTYAQSGWVDVYVFGFIIAVLVWRPTGLRAGVSGASLE